MTRPDFDIIVSGAGPAGLSFARSLAGSGLRIALIEKLTAPELAEPPFDGREIALTQLSVRLMRELGQWQHINEAHISPLRQARVLNGPSPFAMVVAPDGDRHGELGYLVPNDQIRRAAYAALIETPDTTLLDGRRVTGVRSSDAAAELTLDDGQTLRARLAVAADSRFSETRRAMGIPANMHDFGRTMLVCRMTVQRPHDHEALEWFGYGQTLALLPLRGSRASIVLTLPHAEIAALLTLDETAFNREMQRRFDHRVGAMQLVSTRHGYPLVGVYPERFIARRFACIGDAAVGMHPVTAHGFNFGLLGQHILSRLIRNAQLSGNDIAAPTLLNHYEREHRTITRPVYLATNMIARLYGDDRPRALRQAALWAGQTVTPFRKALNAAITGDRETPPLLFRIAGRAASLRRSFSVSDTPVRPGPGSAVPRRP
jgi:ubiquinone biosynthesis UbiH/UbiF/VisC/COQ6 family hydroxylase